MRHRVGLAVVGALVAALTAGCVPAQKVDEEPSPTESGSSIRWSRCTAEAIKLNPSVAENFVADCGTVSVPQDWKTATNGKPADGKTFEIAMMRLRAKDQKDRIGSILINPGGPGGSGYEFGAYLAPQLTGLTPQFDIIGFDPRGVGKSNPVECISNEDLDASFGYVPDPVTNPAFEGLVSINRRIGEDCGAKYGESLSLFSTEQAAQDIDAIRAALGEEKLNYLGFSYGTLLGAVYAQLFPTKIRAMVLDGAVDPTVTAAEGSEGQAMGFERALNNFSTWCKANASSCKLGADPRKTIENAIAQAQVRPATGEGGRKATAGWVFYSVVSSLYSEEAWPYLARAMEDLAKGDPRVTFLLADSYAERDENGEYSNLFDANNAVNCADSDYPTQEQIRDLQSQWRTKYPLFGAPLATGMLTCSLWPAKKDPYPTGKAEGAPPIVVIGTKGDPATPYESTPKLANMLGVGTVVTWEGEGHTAYPNTTCIRTAVDDYFIDLTVPAKDLTCPAK